MEEKQVGGMKPETRRLVSAILFAIAGTLLVVTIIIWIAFADELNGVGTTNIPNTTNAPISTQNQYEQVDLQTMAH